MWPRIAHKISESARPVLHTWCAGPLLPSIVQTLVQVAKMAPRRDDAAACGFQAFGSGMLRLCVQNFPELLAAHIGAVYSAVLSQLLLLFPIFVEEMVLSEVMNEPLTAVPCCHLAMLTRAPCCSAAMRCCRTRRRSGTTWRGTSAESSC